MSYLRTKTGLIWFTAFVGATMYEFQLGPFWGTFMRPRFWKTSWRQLVSVGWDWNWAEQD